MSVISKILRWCTTGSATVPTSGKLSTGWEGGKQPEAPYQNYMMQKFSDGINEVNAALPNPNSDMATMDQVCRKRFDSSTGDEYAAMGHASLAQNEVVNSSSRVHYLMCSGYLNADPRQKVLMVYDALANRWEQYQNTNDEWSLVAYYTDTVLSASFASNTWTTVGAASDGQNIYIVFTGATGNLYRMQKFNLTGLVADPVWPSAGIDPGNGVTGTFPFSTALNTRAGICVVDDTYIVCVNPWVSFSSTSNYMLSKIRISNGVIVDHGIGGMSANANVHPTGGICYDSGTDSIWISIGDTSSSDIGALVSADYLDLTAFSSTAQQTAIALTSNTGPVIDVLYTGKYIICTSQRLHSGTTEVVIADTLITTGNGGLLVCDVESGGVYVSGYLCYDGRSLYVRCATAYRVYLAAFDLYQFNLSLDTSFGSAKKGNYQLYDYTGPSVTIDRLSGGPIQYDGRDIWHILTTNGADTMKGIVTRIPKVH